MSALGWRRYSTVRKHSNGICELLEWIPVGDLSYGAESQGIGSDIENRAVCICAFRLLCALDEDVHVPRPCWSKDLLTYRCKCAEHSRCSGRTSWRVVVATRFCSAAGPSSAAGSCSLVVDLHSRSPGQGAKRSQGAKLVETLSFCIAPEAAQNEMPHSVSMNLLSCIHHQSVALRRRGDVAHLDVHAPGDGPPRYL